MELLIHFIAYRQSVCETSGDCASPIPDVHHHDGPTA